MAQAVPTETDAKRTQVDAFQGDRFRRYRNRLALTVELQVAELDFQLLQLGDQHGCGDDGLDWRVQPSECFDGRVVNCAQRGLDFFPELRQHQLEARVLGFGETGAVMTEPAAAVSNTVEHGVRGVRTLLPGRFQTAGQAVQVFERVHGFNPPKGKLGGDQRLTAAQLLPKSLRWRRRRPRSWWA